MENFAPTKDIPTACYSGSVPQKYYQYTVIDEASRERFIYPYMEQSSYSTIDFLKRSIAYFGYQPQVLQTDNGAEFTHLKKADRTHPLDVVCNKLGITHKRIRPRTNQGCNVYFTNSSDCCSILEKLDFSKSPTICGGTRKIRAISLV